MNWNWSGSIRNITAHLVNDKNTSIAETCIASKGKSAANNPSYEFLFFSTQPWDFAPGGRQGRTQMSKSGVPKVWPHDSMYFLWRIRWTTLENQRTKQMINIHKKLFTLLDYEANDGLWANYIFYKKSKFSKLDFMMKNRFLGMKTDFRTRLGCPRPRRTRKTGRKTHTIRKFIFQTVGANFF